MSRITVSTDDLETLVSRIAAVDEQIESEVSALGAQVALTLEVWDGQAASAYERLHQMWMDGLAAMQASLAKMQAAVSRAAANHEAASNTNLRMWS